MNFYLIMIKTYFPTVWIVNSTFCKVDFLRKIVFMLYRHCNANQYAEAWALTIVSLYFSLIGNHVLFALLNPAFFVGSQCMGVRSGRRLNCGRKYRSFPAFKLHISFVSYQDTYPFFWPIFSPLYVIAIPGNVIISMCKASIHPTPCRLGTRY